MGAVGRLGCWGGSGLNGSIVISPCSHLMLQSIDIVRLATLVVLCLMHVYISCARTDFRRVPLVVRVETVITSDGSSRSSVCLQRRASTLISSLSGPLGPQGSHTLNDHKLLVVRVSRYRLHRGIRERNDLGESLPPLHRCL